MWGLTRVEIRGGLLAITDDRGLVEFFRDSHRLEEWLNERLSR